MFVLRIFSTLSWLVTSRPKGIWLQLIFRSLYLFGAFRSIHLYFAQSLYSVVLWLGTMDTNILADTIITNSSLLSYNLHLLTFVLCSSTHNCLKIKIYIVKLFVIKWFGAFKQIVLKVMQIRLHFDMIYIVPYGKIQVVINTRGYTKAKFHFL